MLAFIRLRAVLERKTPLEFYSRRARFYQSKLSTASGLMGTTATLHELFEGKRHQKIILAVSVAILLIVELSIYVAASSQTGQRARTIITDAGGSKIYETEGAALTTYEKMVFENNFGPLRNYNTRVESEYAPFPYRGWALLSVGVPMVLILLVSFLVQSYLFLLNGGRREEAEAGAASGPAGTRVGSFLRISRSISVLQIGFLIAAAVLTLWLVPAFLGDFATAFISAIREYQWFFLGAALFVAFLAVWVIYLRYRLSRQMLENQLRLEMYRVKRELLAGAKPVNLLTGLSEGMEEPRRNVPEMNRRPGN